jgi:prophage endopeptidase
MSELAVKWAVLGLIVLGLMGGSAYTAWEWQANSYEQQLATQASGFQADLLKITTAGATQTSKALAQQQAAEQKAADLDAKRTQEKTDALAQNETLRRAVADGARRLRIAGTCTASGNGSGGVPQASSAAGLGDAATIELSGAAGQAVFDLRAELVAERAALTALQDYVRSIQNQ